MKKLAILFSLGTYVLMSSAQALISDADITYETVTEELGIPWGMAILPNNQLLVTQRDGQITQVNLENGAKTNVSGGPKVKAEGQGGLLDVALSPEFSQEGWIYFTYSKDVDGQGATTLARAKLEGNALVEWHDLLVTQSRTSKGLHYGSRIVFDNDGHVFFSVGDRGERDLAQDLTRHTGKILRLKLDGSVPTNNPSIGSQKALPEIWTYGHRNPQGLFFNAETNQLWSNEHGPRGGDEINLIEPRKNYGWPAVSLGKEYWGPVSIGHDRRAGMEDPLYAYTPSIAPSGLVQYKGNAFLALQGHLISGALALQHLNILEMDGKKVVAEHRLMTDKKQRIRNVIESPEGWLYVATDSGSIIRLKPAQAD